MATSVARVLICCLPLWSPLNHLWMLSSCLLQVSGGADTFMIITRAVASFIKLYLLLLFVRVLLSWFPTFQWWEQQPFAALRQVGGGLGGRG